MKKLNMDEKLFLVKTKKDSVNHIKLDEAKCAECKSRICLVVCPAETYEEINGKINVSYENCLECGTCRVACGKAAIEWENPRGGFGATFVNG